MAGKTVVSVRVELGARSYDIKIGHGTLEENWQSISQLAGGHAVGVISDDTVWGLYGSRVEAALKEAAVRYHVFTIPEGEEEKSLGRTATLYDELLEAGLERNDLIVAFGGGVVGDLAGFVAATYMRGLPFVQVPTTVVAQVDSSIGGKVGINLPKGKNLVGSFYQPKAVYIDVDLLNTLPERQLKNGLAEVAKYGFLAGDPLLSYLEDKASAVLERGPEVLTEVIRACSAFKAQVVKADELDTARRAILNYGHTLGHAIERVSGYGFLHGEAIAIGMVFAGQIAREMGLLDEVSTIRQKELLEGFGLPVGLERKATRVTTSEAPAPAEVTVMAGTPVIAAAVAADAEALLQAIQVDKKRRDAATMFVLLEGFGKPVVRSVSEDMLVKHLETFLG